MLRHLSFREKMQLGMQYFDDYISPAFKKSYSDAVMLLEDSFLI